MVTADTHVTTDELLDVIAASAIKLRDNARARGLDVTLESALHTVLCGYAERLPVLTARILATKLSEERRA